MIKTCLDHNLPCSQLALIKTGLVQTRLDHNSPWKKMALKKNSPWKKSLLKSIFVLIMNQFNNFLVMENPQNFWWKFAKFFASHSFLVFDTDMSNILKPSKTKRGKAGVIDNHNYFYTANGSSESTSRYWCSTSSWKATLIARNLTGNLVGDTLPDHNHGNKLLKMTAKKTEERIINQLAGFQGATPSAVLQEISTNMFASNFPGT